MILLGENFPGSPSLRPRECGGGGRGTTGGGFLGDFFTGLEPRAPAIFKERWFFSFFTSLLESARNRVRGGEGVFPRTLPVSGAGPRGLYAEGSGPRSL